VKIFVDMLPGGSADFPITLDGAIDFIRQMPKLVEKCNGGKGKPVTFHMLLLKVSQTEPIYEVPDREVLRVERLLSHVDELKQKAYEFKFNEEDPEKVRKCREYFTKQEDDLRCDIKDCVLAVRSGKCDGKRLEEICRERQKTVDDAFRALELLEHMEKVKKEEEKVKKEVEKVKNEVPKDVRRTSSSCLILQSLV